MTRDELVTLLQCLVAAQQQPTAHQYDPEQTHLDADFALLAYINDPEVSALYLALDIWYA